MILSISAVAVVVGLVLIFVGYGNNSDRLKTIGAIIFILAIWLGFFMLGNLEPVTTRATKISPEQIEILRSPTAVHIRTTDGQLSRTYTELVHYNAITDTTTFYRFDRLNSYDKSIQQYITY